MKWYTAVLGIISAMSHYFFVAWAPLLRSSRRWNGNCYQEFLGEGNTSPLPADHSRKGLCGARQAGVAGKKPGEDATIGTVPRTMLATKCDWLNRNQGPESSLDPRWMQMWPKYSLVTFPYHTSFWHLNKQSRGRNLHLGCTLGR